MDKGQYLRGFSKEITWYFTWELVFELFKTSVIDSQIPIDIFLLLYCRPQNMIAQSQSGTGKTAAFVLAMLSRVDTSKNCTQVCNYDECHHGCLTEYCSFGTHLFVLSFIQVLCLSPTFELAMQTGAVINQMKQFCPDIRLKYAVRGEEGLLFFVSFILPTETSVVKQDKVELCLIILLCSDRTADRSHNFGNTWKSS